MTYRCEHCQFEFQSFYLLVLHLASTVADSLGDVGPVLAPGHPEHITPVRAHEIAATRDFFGPAKHCERLFDGGPCPNEAEVFVKWECEACALLMCTTCLLATVQLAQDAKRTGVSTIGPCPGGGNHDMSKFHQPVLI